MYPLAVAGSRPKIRPKRAVHFTASPPLSNLSKDSQKTTDFVRDFSNFFATFLKNVTDTSWQMTEIEVKAEDVRVLLNKTRLSILKHLWRRRYTASELSKILGLAKPTVIYHLSILEKAGYVNRIEDGRKWIYYELTESGKRTLKLKAVKVILVSSLVAFVLVLVLTMPITTQKTVSKPLGVAMSEAVVILFMIFIVISIAIYASYRIIRS